MPGGYEQGYEEGYEKCRETVRQTCIRLVIEVFLESNVDPEYIKIRIKNLFGLTPEQAAQHLQEVENDTTSLLRDDPDNPLCLLAMSARYMPGCLYGYEPEYQRILDRRDAEQEGYKIGLEIARQKNIRDLIATLLKEGKSPEYIENRIMSAYKQALEQDDQYLQEYQHATAEQKKQILLNAAGTVDFGEDYDR